MRLTDLYPEKYPAADGYMTRERLDAGHAESLRFSLDEAGADCRAIITNSPHNTEEATAIVRNLVALAEDGRIDFAAACLRTFGATRKGESPFSIGHLSSARLPVVGALGGSRGAREVPSTPMPGTSGEKSRRAARP